jgi:VanZ family protein
MLIIFYFSSRQTTGIGGNSYWLRFFILKSFHIIEYAILAILLFIALLKFQYTIIFAYLYSLSDEFHQSFIIGRTATLRDTIFDLIGIVFGLFIIRLLMNLSLFKKICPPKRD